MKRFPSHCGAFLVLALAVTVLARTRTPEDLLDAIKGVPVAGRLTCDGFTNPAEDVGLVTTFSSGGWERAFHLDEFENQYCRLVDVYFWCVVRGHDRWKQVWSSDSYLAPTPRRAWLNACSAWQSTEAPQYILSGWYKEGAPDHKLPWKQALLKQVSTDPVIYEFKDPNGGEAKIEIRRK